MKVLRWLGVWVLMGAGAAIGEPRGLILNEDNSHFFGSRNASDMTVEGLRAFVDQYAGTKVSHLFLNPNAMRASYASAVWDRIWDVGGQKVPEGNEVCRRWVDNARLLYERGLDPYAVWISRAREKGISPWLTMRMNDVHDVSDTTNFMHSTFWLKHPEYWRVPGSTGSWTDRAFDYGVSEVRGRSMALIHELLDRYDPDGLELDWMRFGYHFKPGHEAEGCEILTAFMREVRTYVRERAAMRGHAILLGARVPAHPDAAIGLGMDGVRWAKEGLVDMLVPTPFWATSDYDIPVELWKERIGPAVAHVVIAPGAEILLRAHPGGAQVENDLESIRGFAAAAWNRGADQIYLFNYMDPAPMVGGRDAYRALLEQGLAPDTVNASARRQIATYHDTVPKGMPNGAQVPATAGAAPKFRIYLGPAPEKGKLEFLVGLAECARVGEATFDATLNGAPCAGVADHEHPEQFPGVKRAVRFECPLPQAKSGYNDLALTQKAGDPEQKIVWVELRVSNRQGDQR